MDQGTKPAGTTGPPRSGLYHLVPDDSITCIFGAPLDGEALELVREMAAKAATEAPASANPVPIF